MNAFNDYWKVTRSLVSYDLPEFSTKNGVLLKGHQIIGELRHKGSKYLLSCWIIERSPDHWWVTTAIARVRYNINIERSPDHWWVTTLYGSIFHIFINWKVTRSLVSYDLILQIFSVTLPYWKVTRSLVSYDSDITLQSVGVWVIERSPDHWWVTTYTDVYLHCLSGLKGHQIIGELRPWSLRVGGTSRIERSPDHWWVTTCFR